MIGVGERELPPLPILSSCGWTNNKNGTRLTRGKETNLIGAHGGVVEIGPKKLQGGQFLCLDKETIHLWETDRAKKLLCSEYWVVCVVVIVAVCLFAFWSDLVPTLLTCLTLALMLVQLNCIFKMFLTLRKPCNFKVDMMYCIKGTVLNGLLAMRRWGEHWGIW